MVGSGSIGFFANNPGTLILNGNNTYSGDTTVTNGTLGGYGSLAGNLVTLGGTLSPGWPALGTLTVNGNVTLGGIRVMEIDRAQSPNSDRLVVGGALAFGGDLQVVLASGASAPESGDVYQLFSKGGSVGFDNITLPDLSALPGELSWNTDELLASGYISVVGAAVPPAIQPPYISDGHLILAGDGGVANGSYAVLTSTNVAAPVNEWVTNTTGTFSASGAFSNAIPINPADAQRYFRVKQP
jgi:autotransporter-associated beta strand protein